MPQFEVMYEGAIDEEKRKSKQMAKLLEVLSSMGVELRPGVTPDEVFTTDLESTPFPSPRRASRRKSVPPESVPWEPSEIGVEVGEVAEGKARGSAKRIAIGEARRMLGRVVTEAHYTDKDYIVERHGKPEAAIIGIEDYERLQRLENERDVHLLQKAKGKAQRFVSAEQLVSDYEERFGEKISTPSEEG